MARYDDKQLARLSAYLDGALADGEREALEAELAADAGLRAELAAYRRVDNLVLGAASEVPAVNWTAFGQAARARRAAQAAPRVRRFRPALYRVYAPLAAAAALAVVVTAALFYQDRPHDSPGGALATAGGGSRIVVEVERAGLPAAAAAKAEIVVSLDQGLPPDAIATVPALPARTLVIAGGIETAAPVAAGDDAESLF